MCNCFDVGWEGRNLPADRNASCSVFTYTLSHISAHTRKVEHRKDQQPGIHTLRWHTHSGGWAEERKVHFLSIHHCVKLPVIMKAFPLLPFHIRLSPIQTLNQPLKSNDATPTVRTKKAPHSAILLGHIPAPQPLKQQLTFHSITVLTLMVMSSPFVPSMLYFSPCVACRWLLQGSKGLIGGSAVCRHTTGFIVWCDILGDFDISSMKKGA